MKSLGPDFQEYEAVLHKVAAFSDPLWRKFESRSLVGRVARNVAPLA